MKVSICIPWRDRAWVAPYTLASLAAQTYPKELLSVNFIAHNCIDSTEEILAEWIAERELEYRYASLRIVQDDTPPDGRTSNERDRSERDPRHAQARLKNSLKDSLDPGEFFFFCDSDILLHPRCIESLVKADKDIVGGLAAVTPQRTLWNYFPRTRQPGQSFLRDFTPVPQELTQVGLVAGIILYSPRACRACNFLFVGTGEDEGAIRDAERVGIGVWLEPRAKGEHVMLQESLPESVGRWRAWVTAG